MTEPTKTDIRRSQNLARHLSFRRFPQHKPFQHLAVIWKNKKTACFSRTFAVFALGHLKNVAILKADGRQGSGYFDFLFAKEETQPDFDPMTWNESDNCPLSASLIGIQSLGLQSQLTSNYFYTFGYIFSFKLITLHADNFFLRGSCLLLC